MYHPSRGGVRGGADQFSWENVKTDKHRENYLGHSVMAPVGRWQKGKDLSWYSKDRSKNAEEKNSNFSEIAAVKKAEEEAMLAALGHKVVKKEAQPLTKEEMAEVLKRNQGERECLGVDRVEGVGIASARAAMLVHPGKHGGTKTGGVTFEAPPLDETNPAVNSSKELNKESYFQKSSSNTGKKGSKKHKKEKKHKKKKKHKRRAYSGSSDNEKEIKSANERSAEKHFIPKACKSMSEDFMLLKCSASNENDYRNSLMNKDIQSDNKRKERQLSASESDSGTKYDAVKEAFSSDSESNGHILYNKERTKAHSYGKPYNKRKRHDSTSDSEPDKKGSQSKEVNDSTSELTSEIEYNQRDFKTEFDLKDFSSKHATYKSSKNTTSVSQCHNIYEENRNVDSQKYKFSSSHALRDSSTSIHYKKKSDTNFKYMYKSSEKKSDKCTEMFCGHDLTKKQRQRHDSSSD